MECPSCGHIFKGSSEEKARRKKRREEKRKLEHPKKCYCDYEDRIRGKKTGEMAWVDGHPLYNTKKRIEYDLVMCDRCNLPFVDAPVFA